MKRRMKTVLALTSLVFLCGCFHIQVYHRLARFGNSDSGGWQIYMDNLVYAMFSTSNDFAGFMEKARSFSNPSIRTSGNTTYIEDLSGRASMEHIYDRFNCIDDPQYARYAICTFSASSRDIDVPGWSVDWTIDLDPDMQMLESNNQRSRVENGRRQYIWYFDANTGSSFNVAFTVRVPRA